MVAKTMMILVALIVVAINASFAFPAVLATSGKDFISREAYEATLTERSKGPLWSAMLEEDAFHGLVKNKIIISDPVLEELLFSDPYPALGDTRTPCRDDCHYGPCVVNGCYCRWDKRCFMNSLIH